MRRVIGLIACFLLAGCTGAEKKVFLGPSAGIEYHNQDSAPLPWISITPSARALTLKGVSFPALQRQLRHDMALEAFSQPFKDVRLVLLDYTILPRGVKKGKHRQTRYFMTASFYKIGKRPPCAPDFEITTSINTSRAARREAMRYMLQDIVAEICALYAQKLLTPGKKIMVNLD